MPRIHTSRDFEAELRELRAHSLAMGARCERSLQLALEAFWSGLRAIGGHLRVIEDHRHLQDDSSLRLS